MVEEIFSRLFDLDVARERGDDGLPDSLRFHFLDDLDHDPGEDHRWSHDGVPIPEDERVDARILEPEPNRVLVGLWRLAAGDVDGVAGSTEWWNELAEGGIEVGRHRHERQSIVHDRVG